MKELLHVGNWYAYVACLLLFGHMLADYPLQGDFLVKAKRGVIEGCPWWVGLLAHCWIHAGFVLLFTHSLWLMLAELVAHFIIDKLKCAGRTNMIEDQALHVGCKLVWAAIAVYGGP